MTLIDLSSCGSLASDQRERLILFTCGNQSVNISFQWLKLDWQGRVQTFYLLWLHKLIHRPHRAMREITVDQSPFVQRSVYKVPKFSPLKYCNFYLCSHFTKSPWPFFYCFSPQNQKLTEGAATKKKLLPYSHQQNMYC